MPVPINTDHPGYDAECMVDLTAAELAELDLRDAMAGAPVDYPTNRERRRDARCYVLLTLAVVLVVLCWSGVLRSEESEPRYPGESRAWMGNTLQHDLKMVAWGKRR